jgi:hypothetical protein
MRRMARRYSGWLAAEEVDGEADAVEDGGTVVAGLKVAEGGVYAVKVRGEFLDEGGRAVKADDGHLVLNAAEEGIEHGGEGAIDVEVLAAFSSGLNEDDEGEGLRARVFVEIKLLLDAVVGKSERVGTEGVDHGAAFGAHERGNKDEGGAGGDGRGGGRLIRLTLGLILGTDDQSLRGDQKEGEEVARPEHQEFSIATVNIPRSIRRGFPGL